jgi:hypothetical protein
VGQVFIQTHHTFPIHSFPCDYYRFSPESLELLCTDSGLEVMGTALHFPVMIVSDREPNAAQHPAFLNVSVVARKPA